MKISKLSFILCALAIGAIGLPAPAEDTPAQAAARIALAKQLFEESASQASNAPAGKVVSSQETEAQAKKRAAQAAADAKAKAAADQQLADQQAARAKAKQAADKNLADAQAARAKAAAASKAQAERDAAAKAKQQKAQAKAEAKAKKEQSEKKANVAPASPTAAAPKPAANTDNAAGGQELGLKPIAPPPLPISASKADRLAALLNKYKADQISPEEYHQQRAAILAEP